MFFFGGGVLGIFFRDDSRSVSLFHAYLTFWEDGEENGMQPYPQLITLQG